MRSAAWSKAGNVSPQLGQGQRVGSCSSHTSTRSSSGFSSTRATCQGVGIPKIVSNSLVSCSRSSAGAVYQQDTFECNPPPSKPPPTRGPPQAA